MKKSRIVKRINPVILTFVLVLSMLLPANVQRAYAAKKAKLNKTSAVLTVGKTLQLKVKNTTKQVTWSSSEKLVATVSKKGKVVAKRAERPPLLQKWERKS